MSIKKLKDGIMINADVFTQIKDIASNPLNMLKYSPLYGNKTRQSKLNRLIEQPATRVPYKDKLIQEADDDLRRTFEHNITMLEQGFSPHTHPEKFKNIDRNKLAAVKGAIAGKSMPFNTNADKL